MRPTSAELIEKISQALDEQVLPAIVEEKWASSVVRSAVTLLSHLAKRVELEAPVLLADNDEAHAVLAAIAAEGALPTKYAGLQKAMTDVLESRAVIPSYDAVALDARNREYQSVIEALLRALHEDSAADDRAGGIRRSLRAYLKRRMTRERDMYFPAFTGPPF